MEAVKEAGEVLAGGLEVVRVDSVPSWEAVGGGEKGVHMHSEEVWHDECMEEGYIEGVANESSARDGVEEGEGGEVLVCLGKNGGAGFENPGVKDVLLRKDAVLDWKRVVIGGDKRRENGGEDDSLCGGELEVVSSSGGGNSLPLQDKGGIAVDGGNHGSKGCTCERF